jgi:hypothetical protein
MDLHIGNLTSEVDIADQPAGLPAEQIEQIVQIVMARLDKRERERRLKAESMAITPGFVPRLSWE